MYVSIGVYLSIYLIYIYIYIYIYINVCTCIYMCVRVCLCGRGTMEVFQNSHLGSTDQKKLFILAS